MPHRLVVLALFALPLVAIACSGPAGLTASGGVSVRGSTASGPFEAAFDFPSEVRLDGSAGLTAMCTISGGGAVIDLIPSAGNPLETVTLMARNDATSGTIEADVRGEHYSNPACAYSTAFVGGDGTISLRTATDCVLSSTGGGTVTASSNIVLRGCTVVAE